MRMSTAMVGERAGDQKSGEDVQLPSTVTQLGTSLANVQMANLVRKEAALVYRLDGR